MALILCRLLQLSPKNKTFYCKQKQKKQLDLFTFLFLSNHFVKCFTVASSSKTPLTLTYSIFSKIFSTLNSLFPPNFSQKPQYFLKQTSAISAKQNNFCLSTIFFFFCTCQAMGSKIFVCPHKNGAAFSSTTPRR